MASGHGFDDIPYLTCFCNEKKMDLVFGGRLQRTDLRTVIREWEIPVLPSLKKSKEMRDMY